MTIVSDESPSAQIYAAAEALTAPHRPTEGIIPAESAPAVSALLKAMGAAVRWSDNWEAIALSPEMLRVRDFVRHINRAPEKLCE